MDVMQVGFFVLFWRGCLGDMMGVRVVMEVIVGSVCWLVWWCWCGGGSVRMGVGVGSVGNRGEGMVSSGGNVSVTDGGVMVEELGGRIVADSPIGFLESSGKTSHIVSHSRSISTMSFCRLVCKEEVV